jgi:hypothetical protein
VLGLAMDLEIRQRTKNAKSLDDAMRHLYDKFSGKHGFMSEDVVLGILESTGVDLHDFFLRHVSAAQEVDWPKHLAHMGVKAEYKVSTPPATALDAEVVEGAVKITVLEGSALHRGGLRTGDIVKDIDGSKVQSANAVRRLLAGMAVGAKVDFGVLRDGKERAVSVVVEPATDFGACASAGGPSEAILEGIGEASPLHRAGLRNGDVLMAMNGTPIGGRDEARRALAASPPRRRRGNPRESQGYRNIGETLGHAGRGAAAHDRAGSGGNSRADRPSTQPRQRLGECASRRSRVGPPTRPQCGFRRVVARHSAGAGFALAGKVPSVIASRPAPHAENRGIRSGS